MNIYDAIKKERNRQDKDWGGADHDDQHNVLEWMFYIQKQLVKAVTAAEHESYFEAQRKFVQIAALSIAAAESLQRRIDGIYEVKEEKDE